MPHIYDIPLEIIEEILLCLHHRLQDVASFAQSARSFRALIYEPADDHLWRELYLLQPFDHPSTCVSYLGIPRSPKLKFDWRSELQALVHAQTVLTHPDHYTWLQRRSVVDTLLQFICNIPAHASPSGEPVSRNLKWAADHLSSGAFFDAKPPGAATPSDLHTLARLHTLHGTTPLDAAKRSHSRAAVYNMRYYGWNNDFGPFIPDSGGRVDWDQLQAMQHVVAARLEDLDEDIPYTDPQSCMRLPLTQSVIPEGMDLDTEPDWAGVAGSWECGFCFCDHRELLAFNNFGVDETGAPKPEFFDDPEFSEVYRSLEIKFAYKSSEHDPEHPTRPKINFVGEMMGHSTMFGWVKMTPDDQVRWHFVAGQAGNAIWSCEGVQVGGVRSPFGVIGAWTTVFHHIQDPVGPLWLHKLQD
ncbi:hypothetical protein PLICRDRAFT_164215 [Plicaturopsis crispa FD-325 SS-3]|nr:hypothetical protein PLICRDRAFT_164215 [Plicaturopsis crispa FD-325 SS-3]